jgi:hypothetical protein
MRLFRREGLVIVSAEMETKIAALDRYRPEPYLPEFLGAAFDCASDAMRDWNLLWRFRCNAFIDLCLKNMTCGACEI